ncbi:hypothetical protein RhiirA4_484750 [Rhizophagus irregularis]|uniref:Uncharacterized protein n=1 Tax=Rhizophagus irregularis TaxID=588596 RepID=A0A2I1HPC3_9GLOM|nr:hypothetical protein RhiirA4_484750 [Rhizophagus irregularis]
MNYKNILKFKRDLDDTLKNTFEIVGEQAKITKEKLDRMKSTETRLNQLECQKDRTEFLSDYRLSWSDLTKKYGEKELHEAERLENESNKLFHNNEQTLTEAVERLNNPLPNNVNKYKALLQRALKAIDICPNISSIFSDPLSVILTALGFSLFLDHQMLFYSSTEGLIVFS